MWLGSVRWRYCNFFLGPPRYALVVSCTFLTHCVVVYSAFSYLHVLHYNLNILRFYSFKRIPDVITTQIRAKGADVGTIGLRVCVCVCVCLLPGVVCCRDVRAALLTFSMKWKVSDASGVFGGAFSFSEDGQPCIIDHKTLLQCYFIFQAQLMVNLFVLFLFFLFFLSGGLWINACTVLVDCVFVMCNVFLLRAPPSLTLCCL